MIAEVGRIAGLENDNKFHDFWDVIGDLGQYLDINGYLEKKILKTRGESQGFVSRLENESSIYEDWLKLYNDNNVGGLLKAAANKNITVGGMLRDAKENLEDDISDSGEVADTMNAILTDFAKRLHSKLAKLFEGRNEGDLLNSEDVEALIGIIEEEAQSLNKQRSAPGG